MEINNMNLTSYKEAQLWINSESKKYKSKNEFYRSDEYSKLYPHIKKLYEKEQDMEAQRAQKIMETVKLNFGDKVEYTAVGLFFNTITLTGTIVNIKGIPHVKYDTEIIDIVGKKRCRWHKGWILQNEKK